MPKQFVSDLVANAKVSSPFVVKEKTLASFRNKPGKYLSLTLGDRTGDIKGRVWDNAEQVAAQFEVGDVVAVLGRVDEYQGQLQLVVERIAPAEGDSYDPAELTVRAARSEAELLAELDEKISQVEDTDLRALLQSIFGEAGFRARFAASHGARSLHHSYLGGLLEHTLHVVDILWAVAALYPEMDRDLLTAGGLLHDIGKTEELEGVLTSHYTDLGRFVGHTVLTDRMVTAKMGELEGFPPHKANLLTHMLLSHHGEKEWGAPVLPSTMEACALHYADNLDARVQGFKQVIAQEGAAGGWSEYHRSYQRAIYLGPPPEPGSEPPAAM